MVEVTSADIIDQLERSRVGWEAIFKLETETALAFPAIKQYVGNNPSMIGKIQRAGYTGENKKLNFCAKTSRQILKAIRYGMEIGDDYFANIGGESEKIKDSVAKLRKMYLSKRKIVDEKRSGFGNIIFFQLLQEKYPEFQYRLNNNGHVESKEHLNKYV